MRGWAGYFYFQHCTRDFSALRWFLEDRVRAYLQRKHQHRSRGYQVSCGPLPGKGDQKFRLDCKNTLGTGLRAP